MRCCRNTRGLLFRGLCGCHQRESAAVCDLNPPRPFARYRENARLKKRTHACQNARFIRSEKSQNKSSPNFANFRPEFCSRILLRIFPEFFEEFSCFILWETETRKNSPKIPAIFQCKFPGKFEEKIHKILLESRQNDVLKTLACQNGIWTSFKQW